MAQAKTGDTVQVHYTGKLEDGTVFDTSAEREPLAFTLGEGQVIPGFEEAVLGLQPGESATTRVEPQEGYGPRRDDLVIEVEKERITGEQAPEVGQPLQLSLGDGRSVPVRVVEVSSESVTIDANHPLAGQTLLFDVELVGID